MQKNQDNENFEETIDQAIKKGERLYSTVEIAHILQISQVTAQGLCRNGKIRAVKLPNGMWKTTREELMRYIRQGPYKKQN